MRVLLLSANTGGGHNAAAAAIAEELSRRGIESETRDSLCYLSERASEFISWGHSYVYRNLPHLFGRAYRFEEKHSPQLLYDSMALGAQRFYKDVKDDNFTAIICVHMFAAMIVSQAVSRYGMYTPFYFVATDYTCSPGGAEIIPDAWFIPAADLTEEFVSAGVPRERIVPTGIPVRCAFFEEYGEREKQQARQQLHLPLSEQVVLLFTGSIGCGHLNRIAPVFDANLPSDTRLVILCGHNESAYRRLAAQNLRHTTLVGYTDEIARYMAAADVVIGKPGGLSVTEMMTMYLPMVLVLSVPGCESRNLEYLSRNGYALGAKDWKQALCAVRELLEDETRRRDLVDRLRQRERLQGAVRIVDYVLSQTGK